MIYTFDQFINENKGARKHYLIDEDGKIIHEYELYNATQIKTDIIAYLEKNPEGELSHEKEQSESDKNKYVGNDVINFYQNNPKTGKPSKVETKGTKEYYVALTK